MEIAKSLIETLKKISGCFKEADIKFCLIGGLAVGIVAKPRATEDIDLLILVDEENKEPVAQLLEDNFEVIKMNDVMHFKNAAIWRIIIKETLTENSGIVVLDLLFANNEIYKEAVMNSVLIKIDAVGIPIARPDNLIKIKKLSGRPQDLIDIKTIRDENIDL